MNEVKDDSNQKKRHSPRQTGGNGECHGGSELVGPANLTYKLKDSNFSARCQALECLIDEPVLI